MNVSKLASTTLPKTDVSAPLSRPTKVTPLTPNIDTLAEATIVSIGAARETGAKASLARFQPRKGHDDHAPVSTTTKRAGKTFSSRI